MNPQGNGIFLKSMSSFFVGGATAVLEGLPVEYRSMVLRPYTLEKAKMFGFDQPYLEACV